MLRWVVRFRFPVRENQIVPIEGIGGDYPHGYNPGNGKPAITCKECDCALVTAFNKNAARRLLYVVGGGFLPCGYAEE